MSKNIRVLTWFNFFTEFKLYEPIAIIYFAQVSGSFLLGTGVFSIARVSAALFEIPTGVFSDRIGRRKTVILGALCAILFITFYAIGHSFWFLAIGAVFEGLSIAFYSGNNDALLYDTLLEKKEVHKYAQYLGQISKMFPAALAISALLGGGVLAIWSLSLIVWISVIPQIICLILAFRISEPSIISKRSGNIYQNLKEAYSFFVRNRKLRLLSISSILGDGFGSASFQFQSAFYNTIWPIWAIPIAKALSHIGLTIGFHYSGKIFKRFNVFKVIIAGNLYTRMINIASTAFPTILSPIIMTSSSIFYGPTLVGRNSLMQKEFRNEQRATMGSLNSFATSIFIGIVSLFLGFTADKLSPAHALLIVQFFHASNLIFYYKLFKFHKS